MSFSMRIVALFVTLALVGAVLLLTSAGRSFQQSSEIFSVSAQRAVGDQSAFAWQLYARDSRGLKRSLTEMSVGKASNRFVSDPTGDVLARVTTEEISAPDFSLASVRSNASVASVVATTIDADGVAVSGGFWSSLLSDRYLVVSVPVFGAVDPTRAGVSAEEFTRSRLNAGERGGSIVMGYVQVSRATISLAVTALAAVMPSLLLLLLVAGALGFYALRLARQVAPPTVELQALNKQIRQGNIPESVDLGAQGEFRAVEDAISQIIDGLRRRGEEIEASEQLLNLKVNENASELSTREKQLRQASEEITRARDRLHRASYYDSLTSLPNRALFTDQFRQMLRLRERDERPLALLLVNLKNFKRINETLGHNIGDLLLSAAADRLKGSVQGSEVILDAIESGHVVEMARIGGGEFALVLNQLEHTEAAGEVAQRLIDALQAPFTIDTHEIVLPASVGIALAPVDGEDVDRLMRAAATAVQHGHESRDQGVVFFSSEMNSHGVDRFRLEAELRKAIERQQLRLHYQPQVDTFDGAIVGAEALLRWQHPELGDIPPYQFIPLAEEIGLIGELGDWVLGEACRQLGEFRAAGLELPRVAMNVSAVEFSTQFSQRVHDVLHACNLPAASLELGLSEGVLMESSQDVDAALRSLSNLGVYLSLDGFGTSGAPIACLGRYDLNEMKIDRSFVTDCDSRADNARLAKGMVALAESLEMRTLAEGVESEAEYRFLSGHGVRIMQGYLFSKPVPAEVLSEQLSVPWYYADKIQRMALTR